MSIQCRYALGGKCIDGETVCTPIKDKLECPRLRHNLMFFNPAQMIAIVWQAVDVIQVREGLSAQQAKQVLDEIWENHDADTGVSWDTLGCISDEMFG